MQEKWAGADAKNRWISRRKSSNTCRLLKLTDECLEIDGAILFTFVYVWHFLLKVCVCVYLEKVKVPDLLC